MRRVLLIMAAVLMVLVLALGAVSTAQAANPPGTGQPSQSCQAQPSSPGNLNKPSSNPNTPFNETVPGGNRAGNNYAGAQPQNSVNPKSVAQYDVACFQVSTNGGHTH